MTKFKMDIAKRMAQDADRNLSGVTVEGVPIDKYIEDMQEKYSGRKKPKPDSETTKELKETIKQQRICIPKIKMKDEIIVKETKKVSKSVRHLSSDETRKEYSIMEKPFETVIENIFWLMVNEGPISVAEMEDKLGKKRRSLSGVVYRIYKRMGKEKGTPIGDGLGYYIIRCKEVGSNAPQKYYAADNMNAKELYREYTALGVKDSIPKDRVKPKVPEKRLLEGLNKVFSEVLGMDVTVSGKIDVVFSWKR
ncbi:hypothetical protein LCGC14_1790440 [marine sediment metagenome]|uniref:Uncharacterized protein n=1 Tax=marine sediment metagenome TaxID=412755 RepID=A0A0F9JSB2_9ZZZZ